MDSKECRTRILTDSPRLSLPPSLDKTVRQSPVVLPSTLPWTFSPSAWAASGSSPWWEGGREGGAEEGREEKVWRRCGSGFRRGLFGKTAYMKRSINNTCALIHLFFPPSLPPSFPPFFQPRWHLANLLARLPAAGWEGPLDCDPLHAYILSWPFRASVEARHCVAGAHVAAAVAGKGGRRWRRGGDEEE